MERGADSGTLPSLMGSSNGHELVASLLKQAAAKGTPGGTNGQGAPRLLDVPSGEGPVLHEARDAGFEVIEVDLFPRSGMRGVVADACKPFPFQDESFDWVLSMEGIEHFENQTEFLRECSRVLRPGGTLILTTPNILHLNARFSALCTGNRLLKHGFINEVATLRSVEGDRIYHGHAYLVDAFRLRYMLRVVGLELTGLHGTSISGSSVLMAPIFPLIWGLTHLSQRSARKRLLKSGREAPSDEIDAELRRIAFNPALLFRKKLVYVAQKPARKEATA